MLKQLEMVGKKVGRLTVVAFVKKNRHSQSVFLCKCECGNTKEIIGTRLNKGRVQSCGCLNKEAVRKANTTHGMKGTQTYNSWMIMIQRCTNKNKSNYADYGGRGIKVCERWSKFENFLVDMGERPTDKTIDRIRVNGNYEPSNCKWSTQVEQHNNRRNNRRLTVDGETKTIAQWAKDTGQGYHIIHERARTDRPKKIPYTDREIIYGRNKILKKSK